MDDDVATDDMSAQHKYMWLGDALREASIACSRSANIEPFQYIISYLCRNVHTHPPCALRNVRQTYS